MKLKVQHLLSAGASVLAIGAGVVVTQAAPVPVGALVPGETFTATGSSPTQWTGTYVLTDIDDTTPTVPATLESGVVVSAIGYGGGGGVSAYSPLSYDPGGTWTWIGRDLPGNADAVLTNGGGFVIKNDATATTTGNGEAEALVYVGRSSEGEGAAVWQTYSAAGDLNVALNNTGSLSIRADASATSKESWAEADANIDAGIVQNGVVGTPATTIESATVAATGHGNLALKISNTGTINLTSSAVANAGMNADADADIDFAISQQAVNHSPATAATSSVAAFVPSASAELINAKGAQINVMATATANGTYADEGWDVAEASADIDEGIDQFAQADYGVASVTLSNAGAMTFGASATATARVGDADADADLDEVIEQTAEGINATIALTNAQGGTINAAASATVSGVYNGGYWEAVYANASIEDAVYQSADSYGGAASITLTNAGTFSFAADATATNTAGLAEADADVRAGIYQDAEGLNASVALTNASGGVISSVVSSKASGVSADASATSIAIQQYAYSYGEGTKDNPGSASVAFANAGKLTVSANAAATAAEGWASAEASATGVVQYGSGPSGTLSFANSGTFDVSARAESVGPDDQSLWADASALGYRGVASGLSIDVSNAGAFNVQAYASGHSISEGEWYSNGAYSGAVGIEVVGEDGAAGTPATVLNTGTLTVSATAIDTAATASVPGLAWASATGILLRGSVPNAEVTNTGTIMASAVTANGHDAGGSRAGGIRVDGYYYDETNPKDLLTITNTGGTIIARTSDDKGATWQWGDAINTVYAGSKVAINLNGGANGGVGTIYGNINVQYGDVITVANGETQLNGVINAQDWAVVADNAVPSIGGPGALTIVKGGTLYLRDNPEGTFTDGTVIATNYNGPSKVYVDSFTNKNGGILAIEGPNYPAQDFASSPQVIPYAEYPQVFANTADLSDGLLELRPSSDTGLYDDTFEMNDVIVANTITGELADVYTRSILLDVTAHQDDLYGEDQTKSDYDTIDVVINRVAFNAPKLGLNINQTSVATDIENTYTPALAGTNPAYAGVVADLFKMESHANYALALDMLSADLYAGYLRSTTMAGARFNGLIYDMSECGKGSITNELCRSENGGPRLWITGNYGDLRTDGDEEASAFKSKQYFIAAGLDFAVTPNFVLGVAGAYLENNNKFDLYDGRIKSDGWQAGVYGNYDAGKFYLKGAISYSELDGEARRTVDFRGLGASVSPTSTHGTITGEPDVNVWAAGAEAGVRFPLGDSAAITPYASLDYAHAKLKRFTEEGLSGANLTIHGSDEFFASELGIELTAQWGNVAPYVRGGWQHNFGDKRAEFQAAFAQGPADSGFDIISERFAPDAGVVEAGLAAQLSPRFNAHLGYQGRFTGNVEEHSGGLTLSYVFGGAQPAAPPAPPAPVTPPPPPPAPPQVVCNKGPYIVFFDWDKADITPEASGILDSAVTAYGNCDVVPIMLAGYTDRSGSDRYNMGLSARRNTSVQDYLTGRGVPADRISAQAFGEANNRVPTADGVRELQNRRVEITYGPGSGN